MAYIKSNKTLIDAITTSKVSVSDIVNNLTTNVANKPLSAAQGVVLPGRIETVRQITDEIERELADKLAADELPEAIENALAQAKENGEFDGAAGPQGPQGDPGPAGADGPPGDDYVLTDADRQEIAELAAGLVEVPGGGCSIDTWEHINTITVGADAPTSITFSTDHNGNAFALRMLFCTIQNTEAKQTYITWTITGSNATKEITLGITNQAITEEKPLKFLAEIEGNFLKSHLSGSSGNYYRFSHDFVNGLDSCKELSFRWGTGSPFSDGAVVTLYGVRV